MRDCVSGVAVDRLDLLIMKQHCTHTHAIYGGPQEEHAHVDPAAATIAAARA